MDIVPFSSLYRPLRRRNRDLFELAEAPFGGDVGWDLDYYGWPVSRSDALMRRTARNARQTIAPLTPILSADIVEKEGGYEVHVGKRYDELIMIRTDTHTYLSDLPGVEKEDLDLSVSEGYLVISAERRKVHDDETAWGTHRIERAHGRVSRTLALPVDADLDGIQTGFQNGVLQLRIPKLAQHEKGGTLKLTIA